MAHAVAATPCDNASHPSQCGWFDAASLPPFVRDAVTAKGGTFGSGNVLVLTSGVPGDADSEISNDVGAAGCGTNPDGWETFDCVQMHSFVPPEDSVVLALSSEWFEWYQTIFTDWMTISGAGVSTVDVSINGWIDSKVDILPYGPMETGAVILTSLSAQKMVDFRVADSGDHIYDTALVVVPASWFADLDSSNTDVTLLCGDGKLDPGEECDDANHDSDDGCSTLCLGTQPVPPAPPASMTCGNLVYAWPTGLTLPYTCGADLCAGFRCVVGNTISPACYTAGQCAAGCAGSCVDVQTAVLDCSTMCTVQPPATEDPPVLPDACDKLVYAWDDGTTMPYTCDDDCNGQRCVIGSTISPVCFEGNDCDETTCPGGACIDTPSDDCASLCASGDLPSTCSPAEIGQLRPAANQNGACFGNVEECRDSGEWRLYGDSVDPEDERCNGIDDDCNGAVDDMFVTCGDPGLCQTTVNACDPAHPDVPVACIPLAPPSAVEICNNGLDDDCEGAIDDGCECGDEECMPGESFSNCPADCPPPADGTPCEDGNLCTTGDEWQNGTCVAGTPVSCDSGNACVVDAACDPATGCSATKVNCDDGDACTIDDCDVVTGCRHEPDPACAGKDLDGDGYVDTADGGDDCDDSSAGVHPGAGELCNTIDEDCDGASDETFDVGSACNSAPNDCGTIAGGSTVCAADGLGVECSASTPANPAGYGDACTSLPNACGETAAGTIGCDGACSAVTPVAADGDADGVPDCSDGCPLDPAKTTPGVCGCGVGDADSNSNGIADCIETARADLGIALERLNDSPQAGKKLRFRIEVTNLGPSRVLPGAAITVSITGQASELKLPVGCTGTLSEITCTTSEIAAGRTKRKTVSVVPAAGATVAVTASVSSPVLDPNTANQSATLVTTVP